MGLDRVRIRRAMMRSNTYMGYKANLGTGTATPPLNWRLTWVGLGQCLVISALCYGKQGHREEGQLHGV